MGKYTSPHILKFNERIRANGKDISDEEIALTYEKVKNAIKNIGITPTFFEVTTAMMFLYFAEKKFSMQFLKWAWEEDLMQQTLQTEILL